MTSSDILINTVDGVQRVRINASSQLKIHLEAHQLQSEGCNKLIHTIVRIVAIKFKALNPNAHKVAITPCADNETYFATK